MGGVSQIPPYSCFAVDVERLVHWPHPYECMLIIPSEDDAEGSGSGSGSEEEEEGEDVDMEGKVAAAVPAKAADPNDLSAYNLDTYDEEESKGTGK
jgi:hypothetical protein